jgi:hypothetical protein
MGFTLWVRKHQSPFSSRSMGFLKDAFQGSHVTSDAGLILVRELDERLGLEAIIGEHLSDSRHGLNTQFRLTDLLRQSIYRRLAGYEDLNDAQRLATDPTFRLIGSPKRWDRSAALTSTLHWFETELLTREENLVGLMAANRDVIGQAEAVDRTDRVVLDMDSSESPVHGQQEGSAVPRVTIWADKRVFDARSKRGGILTRARSGQCRMGPINGRQIGNVGPRDNSAS